MDFVVKMDRFHILQNLLKVKSTLVKGGSENCGNVKRHLHIVRIGQFAEYRGFQ